MSIALQNNAQTEKKNKYKRNEEFGRITVSGNFLKSGISDYGPIYNAMSRGHTLSVGFEPGVKVANQYTTMISCKGVLKI